MAQDQAKLILIIGGSRSGKANMLLRLIKHKRPGNDKINNLYVKDLSKSIEKYQLKIQKAFIGYSLANYDVKL